MMADLDLTQEALSYSSNLTVWPMKDMQQIINTFHYTLTFDEVGQQWTLTKKGYKTIHYSKEKFEQLPALILISDLDINERE